MRKYIHIGYPKNLSTTLQRDFFPCHPEIHHLGVGVGSNIDYIDDDINLICEDYLLYANERKYNTVKYKSMQVLSKYLDSNMPGKKIIGISAELLSFKFSPDHIDSHVKAFRLKEMFVDDTVILIIIRNQIDLLKSLYREVIKIGYPESFQDFIEYVFYYQDRNFALDFCYDQTVELYSKLFGMENIKVLPIENVRAEDGRIKTNSNKNALIEWLCSSLEINYIDLKLKHYNEPLDNSGLHEKMMLNKVSKHDLGMSIYNVVNGHRLIKYFNNDLNVILPKRIHDGLLNKRNSLDRASLKNENAIFREIDYYVDPLIMGRLKDMYNSSNVNLSKMGFELPESYKL
jgi:hypothetical protein